MNLIFFGNSVRTFDSDNRSKANEIYLSKVVKFSRFLFLIFSVLLILLLVTSCSGSSSNQTPADPAAASQNAYDRLKNQYVSQGKVPNLVGLNAVDASDLLKKAGVGALWDPKSFDQNISTSSNFGQVGQYWFVCKQDEAPGTEPSMFGVGVYVSKDCNGYGVLPKIIGLKAQDAWVVIIDHGFKPSYNFSNDLDPSDVGFIVCKQDHPVGSTNVDEDIVLTLSPACEGYGVLPSVVGLKASVAWKILKDHGFNPAYNFSNDLDPSNADFIVCSQDHPVGTTATDEDITLELSANCATSPNNPNSRDGTRIFINEARTYLSALSSDVSSLATYAQEGYPNSTIYPDGSIASDLDNLGYLVPPTKYASGWKTALTRMKTSLNKFDDALAQWESNIINANELTPYANALGAPANAISGFVDSIPYPK